LTRRGRGNYAIVSLEMLKILGLDGSARNLDVEKCFE